LATQTVCAVMSALVMTGLSASRALAQDHDHGLMVQQPQTAQQRKQANELVQTVREVTERFKDVSQAGPDYALAFGCVSGGDYGAMGLHFVNMALVGDGKIDATKPEILLYEPTSNGRLRLTGADYLVFASDWLGSDPAHPLHTQAPELNGQLFHFFDAPNRFGLPPFYTLHVWAWKDNPLGTFTNWNPAVSCDGFNGPTK
jgi:hypothetical protein